MKYLQHNLPVIILILILIGLGTFCIFFPESDFIKIFSWFACAYLSFLGLLLIFIALRYQKTLHQRSFLDRSPAYLIYGFVLLALAVIVILYPDYLVRIIIGLTLIIYPTLRLIVQENKGRFFLNQLWKYVVGIIFIVANDTVLDIFFVIIGIALYVAAGFLILLLIRTYRQGQTNLLKVYLLKVLNKNVKE
ncbi:MAG: hypothetical protein GX661_06560 [Acholeplasmataceae bacterium]|nr:hypothetical protein [Acholeplasmataceae bacterium]